MKINNAGQGRSLSLQVALAALARQAARVLSHPPAGLSAFRATWRSRSAGEILARVGDLLESIRDLVCAEERWPDAGRHCWEEDAERLYAALAALDEYLAQDAGTYSPAVEKLVRRAATDAMTLLAQIAVLRLLGETAEEGRNDKGSEGKREGGK